LEEQVTRSETEHLKKTPSQYRSEFTALKRRVKTPEQQTSHLEEAPARNNPPMIAPEALRPNRFGTEQRRRLRLSAAAPGALVGALSPPIYNREAATTRRRERQVAVIATLRSMGARSPAHWKQSATALRGSPPSTERTPHWI
jgi:hypothetical protein